MHLQRMIIRPLMATALLVGISITGWGTNSLKGQDAPAATSVPVRSSSSKSQTWKELGVLQVISPDIHPEETTDGPVTLDLVNDHPELAWTAPDFPDNRPFYASSSETLSEIARNVLFRRRIYCFEFGFKPVRMIEVDIPQASGKFQRKLIWYMVYRIRYVGDDQDPVPTKDEFGNETFPKPAVAAKNSRRVFPNLVLIEKPTNKEYLDRVIPEAKSVIAAREKIGMPLFDSVEIQNLDIPLSTEEASHEVWGVATWESLDPRIDYFAVQVSGLTNAFMVEKDANGEERFLRKTLQLNFWRPGDTVDELADKIRFGVPAVADPKRQTEILTKYGLPERLDYLWFYR